MTDRNGGLEAASLALVSLAAAVAKGDEATLRTQVELVRAAGVSEVWVDELLLQSVLMVGWPRTLGAAAIWRWMVGERRVDPAVADDIDYAAYPEWTRRGEALCARIYGGNYDKLRENVRMIHPALDAWMVVEGYGRTLSRPGLDPRHRELCVIAQTAVINAPRQLLSHLIGALHVGASRQDIDQALDAARPFCTAEHAEVALEVWAAVRTARGATA